MSTSPLKQIPADCTDAELSAAVATECAGFILYHENREPPMSRMETPEPWCYRDREGNFYVGEPYPLHKEAFAEIGLRWGYMWTRPKFATSADAVLPLLEKWLLVETVKNVYWRVSLFKSKDAYASAVAYAEASTFARAACFCLLQAHAQTVLDAAGNGGAK